jgi:PTS system fructose-specific IIC component
MAAIMAAGMVPALGMGVTTWLAKAKFSQQEREAGKASFVLGLCFISEGAIPFAARDPMRVIPSTMAGGALAGGLSMFFGCTLMALTAGCLCWRSLMLWGMLQCIWFLSSPVQC